MSWDDLEAIVPEGYELDYELTVIWYLDDHPETDQDGDVSPDDLDHVCLLSDGGRHRADRTDNGWNIGPPMEEGP